MKKYILIISFLFGLSPSFVTAQTNPLKTKSSSPSRSSNRLVRIYTPPSQTVSPTGLGIVLKANQSVVLEPGKEPLPGQIKKETLQQSSMNNTSLFSKEYPRLPSPKEIVLPFNPSDEASWNVTSSEGKLITLDHTFLQNRNGSVKQTVFFHAINRGKTTLVFSYKKRDNGSTLKKITYQITITSK